MDWHKLLRIASRELAMAPCVAPAKWSWCSWTTFDRLGEDAGYWAATLPLEREILEDGTSDGGSWGQPFLYNQLAHLIIPRRFYWEQLSTQGFESGVHTQDLERVSQRLTAEKIAHRLTAYVLEVKLY